MELNEKIIFFNRTDDEISNCIANHLKNTGYRVIFASNSVLTCKDEIELFFDQFKESLHGAVLAVPPLEKIYRTDIEHASTDVTDALRDKFVLPFFLLTQTVGRLLAHNGGGQIVFINSIHADKPAGKNISYSLGCSAVQMICREASLIYGHFNVGCYNLMRGAVLNETHLLENEYSYLYSKSDFRYIKGKPQDNNAFNEICEFLLSGKGMAMNGADINADDGFTNTFSRSWVKEV